MSEFLKKFNRDLHKRGLIEDRYILNPSMEYLLPDTTQRENVNLDDYYISYDPFYREDVLVKKPTLKQKLLAPIMQDWNTIKILYDMVVNHDKKFNYLDYIK